MHHIGFGAPVRSILSTYYKPFPDCLSELMNSHFSPTLYPHNSHFLNIKHQNSEINAVGERLMVLTFAIKKIYQILRRLCENTLFLLKLEALRKSFVFPS
jgi:hypothetical protein